MKVTKVNRAATELCDTIDNDCDGQTDESDAADASTWYEDLDLDTYGNLAVPQQSCSQPAGFVADSADCNDNDSGINPGAAEIPGNTIDENCDGIAEDADGDGVTVAGRDCDDTDPRIFPGIRRSVTARTTTATRSWTKDAPKPALGADIPRICYFFILTLEKFDVYRNSVVTP